MATHQHTPKPPDAALQAVLSQLHGTPCLVETIGKGLRQSIDEVIDGPRTGRYSIEQLEKTEKTYIGTKVEIVVRNAFGWDRGAHLDNLIAGHEVDTKFSLSGAWMIPSEAVDQLCLLLSCKDKDAVFSVGLVRATEDLLTTGGNRDGKRTLSAFGKTHIQWLCQDARMPRNFLLSVSPAARTAILSAGNGVQRVKQLFLHVQGELIPRNVIEQVAQQKDPMRRARQMKEVMAAEGVLVLCAKYDREEFLQKGFRDFNVDDWLSLPLTR